MAAGHGWRRRAPRRGGGGHGGAVETVEANNYNAEAAQERLRAFQQYKVTDKPKYASLKVCGGTSSRTCYEPVGRGRP